MQDGPVDKLGIHTHGDGVIHIHPFVTRAAGQAAPPSAGSSTRSG